MELVEAKTLGEAWLEVARAIVQRGAVAEWDGARTRELALLTVAVAEPDPADATIAALGDPEWLRWMHENFFDGAGRDQIAWVVERLRANPEARDATITTFQPHTDTAYVPCVGMLDFWLRDGAVELIVYAHSLDFGKKAYGNLVELAALQAHVAAELAVRAGRLVVHVKTAHVYEPELELMSELSAVTLS